jgi:hypothetical protein
MAYYLILLDFKTLFSEEYKLWCFSLCSFLLPLVTFSLLGSNAVCSESGKQHFQKHVPLETFFPLETQHHFAFNVMSTVSNCHKSVLTSQTKMTMLPVSAFVELQPRIYCIVAFWTPYTFLSTQFLDTHSVWSSLWSRKRRLLNHWIYSFWFSSVNFNSV